MLHEATTVLKAVEQAWIDSGKPLEFTIKVLETEEKGLLWFSKKPAIISITYDIRSLTGSQRKKPERHQPNKNRQPQPQRSTKNFQQPDRQTNRHTDRRTDQRTDRRPDNRADQRNDRRTDNRTDNRTDQRYQQNQPRQNENIRTPERNQSHYRWSDEHVLFVKSEMIAINTILELSSTITLHPDGKKMLINYDHKTLPAIESRLLFASMSNILMQMVKKKFKKKFHGFSIILRTKEQKREDNRTHNNKPQ